MDRTRVGAALFALLAVLALSVAAATLADTSGGTGGGGVGDAERTGVGSGGRFDVRLPTPFEVDSPNPLLFRLLASLAGVVVLAAALVALRNFYEEYGSRGVLAALAVFAGSVVLLYVGLVSVGGWSGFPNRSGARGNDSSLPAPGGASGPNDLVAPATDPPAILAVVFLFALVGGALVLVRATGDDEHAPPAEHPETPGAEALGRVAGEAADRIARGAVTDNEIYRAWRQMTEHLDVPNPAASTPAEFADAAVEAGMDREDVRELTELFEAVRYGDREPTDEREERAVAALRRIEEGYA